MMFSARPAPAPPDHPPLAEVKNQTAKRLVIASAIDDDDQLILPPFNTIRIADGDLATYRYEPWCKRGLITVRWSDERPAPTVAGRDTDAAVGPYGWLTTVIGVVVVAEAIPLLGPPTWQNYAAWIAVGVVLIELAAAYLLFRKVKQVQQGLTDVVRKQPPLSRRALGGVLAAARQAAAWTQQWLTFLLVLVIGCLAPATAIYALGGGAGLIRPKAGQWSAYALLGRSAQLVFIATAATLPALLYFMFHRQRSKTLREKFYREVMMLDPNVQTRCEAEDKYAAAVDESYGAASGGQQRLLSTLPVLISTLLITLGWMLVLLPVGPVEEVRSPGDLQRLFDPSRTAFNYGFLGTYFFALNMVFRRYVRADLTPKAYSHITLRLLVVVPVVWALAVLPVPGTRSAGETPAILLGLAFLVGIFPETGVALINDFVTSKVTGWPWASSAFPAIQEDHPLTHLAGINLYDRARLLEEGIENVESLAHHDLIGLMLRTRIPTPVIVDLFDAAILYLHLNPRPARCDDARRADQGGHSHRMSLNPQPAGAQSASPGAERQEPGPASGDDGDARVMLLAYGIRTATDLERAYREAERRGDADRFLGLLDQKPTHEGIPRLRVILDALYDDEWMAYLRHWRRTCGTSEPVYSPDTFLSSDSDPASPQMAVTWDKLDTIERCKQAVKGFTGYIRRMPHAARGYMGRAEAYWYWGQFANARDDFARALEHARTADDQLRILSGRGQVIAEMVCWGTAPKDHDAEQQGCAEALKDLDQVIESASWVGYRLTVAYARSARALVRAKQRQDAEADQDLEESLAVNPNNAWAYYHRGLVEELRGRTEAAIDAFTQALKKTHPRLAPYQREVARQHILALRGDPRPDRCTGPSARVA